MVVKKLKNEIARAIVAIALLGACGCAKPAIRTGGNVMLPDYNPIFFHGIEQDVQDAQTPFLGVHMNVVPDQSLTETVKKDNAVYIDRIIPESAAGKAGILSGDIVITVDGEPFNSESAPRDQLRKAITLKKAGDSIRLMIMRDGREIIIDAELGVRKRTVPKIKSHPKLNDMQKSIESASSGVYRAIEASGKLEDFSKTLAQLKEQSYFSDSYKTAPGNPFRLSEVNYLLQNPMNIIPVSREITDSVPGSPGNEAYDLNRLLEAASLQLDIELHLVAEAPVTMSSLDDVLMYITDSISRAESFRKEAFKALPDEDRKFLEEEASGILSSEQEMPELQDRLTRIAIQVDYTALFRSVAEASRAVSPQVMEALRKLNPLEIKRGGLPSADLADGDVLGSMDSGFGKIIIGGPGRTRYTGDAFMTIDLGGDDVYENNAGGATVEYPFSITIDLAGNDRYITRKTVSQGAGFMGTGILADVEGNDIYMSEKVSQGAGIFGGGVLLDLHGDDIYKGESDVQGAGIFGIGALIDSHGADVYEASVKSQGFAYVKGFGVLADLEGGDFYRAGGKYPDQREPGYATLSLSQGFAIGMRPLESEEGASGGIGLLIDRDGNDKYIGDYFSQGASYWYSLGILHDMNGDDTYIAGRYSQGAGIHTSAGVLIDEKGDDSYTVTFGVSQGAGHDYGIGVLADFDGDNTYKEGVLSKGAATCGSIGILYDKYGKDSYLTEGGVHESGDESDYCRASGFGILMNGRAE